MIPKISQNFTVMNSNRAVKISTMNYIKYHQIISIQQTVLSKKYYHLQKIQFKL